jgi:hypothetical protein
MRALSERFACTTTSPVGVSEPPGGSSLTRTLSMSSAEPGIAASAEPLPRGTNSTLVGFGGAPLGAPFGTTQTS